MEEARIRPDNDFVIDYAIDTRLELEGGRGVTLTLGKRGSMVPGSRRRGRIEEGRRSSVSLTNEDRALVLRRYRIGSIPQHGLVLCLSTF